tara:strand:+ start:770 stop:1015 length:246 start_codon:yes stop_codon:yes gene_type:complete
MFSGVPQVAAPIKPIVPQRVDVKTVAELVLKLEGCKSAAARALRIDRVTLYNYLNDTSNEYHEIRFHNGRYQLLTVLGTAK